MGHHDTILTEYIYSFHMPLFFLLSGIFHKNYTSYKKFFLKKVSSLIVPYFTFAISLFLFWLIIGRKFGESAVKRTPVIVALKGIILGNDIDKVSSIEWGTPIWFLLCLFLVANLYYFISIVEIKKIILVNIILAYIGYYFTQNPNIVLKIWHFDTALIAINFYTLGNLLKNKILNIKPQKNVVVIMSLMMTIICSKLNGRIDMNANYYSNFLLFYITAIFGVIFIFSLFSKMSLKNYFLEYISQNTLIILAYHSKAMTFIKLILILILNINFSENNLLLNIIFSVIQIFLCIPIIFIFNRYLSFLIGKRRKKECLQQ